MPSPNATEAPSREAATLAFESVSKTYPGSDSPVIEELSLEVPAGEICVLVGPSGCGKTTAMRMVNRMVDMSAGDITIGGRSVRERDGAELRRDIGYVIQQIGIFPHETVAKNVGIIPEVLGWDKQRIAERVDELLDLVGLDPAEVRDRYPGQISGGQRQRVGVARALAVDPPLMLMDEPFGAVDPVNRERLQNEFLRLQAEIRKTIVFVTHDIDEAIKMGDKIAIMQVGGRLAQYAGPAELLLDPANEFVEDFVGADRALKRLSLLRVRDVSLWTAPTAKAGDPAAAVRAELAGAEVPYALAIDADGRPVAWLDDTDLAGEQVEHRAGARAPTLLDADALLRDALSQLLRSGSKYGAVVDSRGALTGVLSVEIVAELLAAGDTREIDPAQRIEA